VKTVGIFEAKTHFSALVDEAFGGKTIVITRNGEPVAELSPIAADREARGETRLDRLRALRARLKGPKVSARELIDEGRR
jgi:prevent-host-death family protein